jgi:hypothetical protein
VLQHRAGPLYSSEQIITRIDVSGEDHSRCMIRWTASLIRYQA